MFPRSTRGDEPMASLPVSSSASWSRSSSIARRSIDTKIAGFSIALGDALGTMIMRHPASDDLVSRPLFGGQTLAQHFDGRALRHFEARDPLDGEHRLVAYRAIPAFPGLYISSPNPWTWCSRAGGASCWAAGSSWVLLSMALGGLGYWLAREMRARGALENRYHTLFDSIPYPVIVSNQRTRSILAVNDATVRQYGWSRDELQNGMTDRRRLPSRGSAAVGRAAARGAAADPQIVQGLRHRRKNGTNDRCRMIVNRIEYDGKPAELTVAVDVSDRLRAESARKAAEDHLRRSQRMMCLDG